MLNAIRDQDPKETAGILARMTLAMMPDPGIEEPPPLGEAEARLRAELLAEIRKRRKLDENDNSAEARRKILDSLYTEFKRITLDRANVSEIKDRVGQKGLLSPQNYTIEFSPTFLKHNEKELGVRREWVRRALQDPDQVQHLFPERELTDPTEYSLYLKWHKATQKERTFALLVLARRKGATQSVLCAYQLFPADVALDNAQSLIDVLKAYAEAFGVDIVVGSRTAKFITYERIPIEDNGEKTQLIAVKGIAEGMYSHGVMLFRDFRDPPAVEVSLAYAIDIDKYKESLRRHGVRLPK